MNDPGDLRRLPHQKNSLRFNTLSIKIAMRLFRMLLSLKLVVELGANLREIQKISSPPPSPIQKKEKSVGPGLNFGERTVGCCFTTTRGLALRTLRRVF